MPKSIIDTALLQAAVDYLQTRPYNEVSSLIADIVNGTEAYIEPKPEKEKK